MNAPFCISYGTEYFVKRRPLRSSSSCPSKAGTLTFVWSLSLDVLFDPWSLGMRWHHIWPVLSSVFFSDIDVKNKGTFTDIDSGEHTFLSWLPCGTLHDAALWSCIILLRWKLGVIVSFVISCYRLFRYSFLCLSALSYRLRHWFLSKVFPSWSLKRWYFYGVSYRIPTLPRVVSHHRTVVINTAFSTAGILVIDVADVNSAMDKNVVMITQELKSFEAEADFSRIGWGVKLHTGISRATEEKFKHIFFSNWIHQILPAYTLLEYYTYYIIVENLVFVLRKGWF